jgi:hypothetical protein
MSNGFGGRTGGNPGVANVPQLTGANGGNRSNQHVVTAGNNNVSYGSPSLLSSAGSLYQQGANRQASTGVGPANGMSMGFIKNTDARRTPASLVPPPPPKPPNPWDATVANPNSTAAEKLIAVTQYQQHNQDMLNQQAGPVPNTSGVQAPGAHDTAEQLRAKITAGGGLKTGSYLPSSDYQSKQVITGLKKYGNAYLPLVGTGANQQVHWAYRSLM